MRLRTRESTQARAEPTSPRALRATCIEEEAVELWKEGGNAKGREGEDRSRTSTRELTLSRGSNGHYPLALLYSCSTW